MTDTEKLEQLIADSGLKKGYIADKIGISRSGFSDLIHNRAEFRVSLIHQLRLLLNMTDHQVIEIFFADGGA